MLYIVGTPIGNLQDMSFRAVETLKSVDEIACEDTRHSATLLNFYGIKKPLFAYHKFNEREAGEKIADKLAEGKNIALITDAGMPIISDPGNILVNILRERKLECTVVPGACAFVSALCLSGLPADRFAFIGFLPEKASERAELLERYKNLDLTLIFYSAPHDVKKDVQSIYSVLGNRRAVAVREITKIHESAEAFNLAENLSGEPRGEYVLLVDRPEKTDFSDLSEEAHIKKYIEAGMDKKEALKLVAKERGVSKSSLYKYTLDKCERND